MKFAIDTNRYSDFARNVPDVVELFVNAEAILVPFVVIAELRAGFRCGTVSQRNEAALALQHNLPLATRDRHFELIPQLSRI